MLQVLRRLLYLLRRSRRDADLREEIETHRSLRQAHLEDLGQSTREAERRSRLALGNTTLAREESHAMWGSAPGRQMLQDLRYALRGLRRSPGFSLATVSMLTIGLGLVSGGYTVFNGVYLRGWNVPDPDAVFVVRTVRHAAQGPSFVRDGFSLEAFEHVHASGGAAAYVAFQNQGPGLAVEAGGRGSPATLVSSNFIEALRIPLQLGTGTLASPPGEPGRVVITDAVWRRLFQSDPAIVGRSAWLDDAPVVVSGVFAPGFGGLGASRLDVVAGFGADSGAIDSSACCVTVAGRRRDGRSASEAEAELQHLTTRYRHAAGLPDLSAVVMGTTLGDELLAVDEGATATVALSLIGAGFVLLLLLTCANVGNLFLARGLRREREIATRLSLGASRSRIVRQLLTEGLVVASAAGTGAFLVSMAVPSIMSEIESDAVARAFEADWRIATFTALAAMATCLLVSLAPALQTTRIAWSGTAALRVAPAGRIRGLLLGVQIAIATVLVFSAALLARGIGQATSLPADFALHTTTLVELLDRGLPEGSEERAGLALLGAAREQGMVFGLANTTVGSYGLNNLRTGVREPGSDVEHRTKLIPLSEGGADVLGLRLARGRWADADPALAEAVVNETLARQIWPNGAAPGRSVDLIFDKRRYRIVGVTRDAHLTDRLEVEPMIHIAPSFASLAPRLLARSDPALEPFLQSVVASAVPGMRFRLTPLTESLRRELEGAAIGASVAALLGTVAVALAGVGLFSVFAYLVEVRRREIGIRVALGAPAVRVASALARNATVAMAGGLFAGLAIAAVAGVVLQRYLYGLSPVDPVSYLVVIGALVVIGLLATAIPARRALRVDPAVSLRSE